MPETVPFFVQKPEQTQSRQSSSAEKKLKKEPKRIFRKEREIKQLAGRAAERYWEK